MNNSSGVYTFYPKFSDYVTLYRGVTEVYIGDGVKGQNIGNLYAVYVSGEVQDIGPVSSYAVAVSEGYAGPDTDFDTPEKWVAHIIETTQNAQTAKDEADRSAMWAAGTSTGDGSSTNNSRSWAEVSKSYAKGTDLNDQIVPDRADDNALYYKNLAKDWAVKSTEIETGLGSSKTYAENSKESSLQSESWAKGTRNNVEDTEREDAPVDNARYYSDQAKGWATGDGSHQEESSKEYSLQSESWAKGTRNNVEDEIRENASTDNASYYNDQAKGWATGDGSHQNESAKEYSLQAESWATGTRNGSTDTVRENAARDNARVYSVSSQTWAEASQTNSRNAEKWATGTTGASYSTGNSAKEQADKAAMWATGGTTGSATATNNAKYYANQASSSASAAAQKATAASNSATSASTSASTATAKATLATTAANNAQTHASAALDSKNEAWEWANGKTIAEYTEGASAKEQADRAAMWAVGNSDDTNPPSYQNNARYYATLALRYKDEAYSSDLNATARAEEAAAAKAQAVSSANNSATSALNASRSETNAATSASNALDRANLAAQWAVWDASGTPSETNNAKYYAEYTDQRITALNNFLSSADTLYANSPYGTTIPTSGWSKTVYPIKGEYIWSKTTFTWTTSDPDTVIYNVSYIGIDGDNIPIITNQEIDALFS